jgi:hypothetical protein
MSALLSPSIQPPQNGPRYPCIDKEPTREFDRENPARAAS